jgi:membrane peptidoglycan carboxypeptidase
VTRALLLTREKTYLRKMAEAVLSFRLERMLSKEEILYIYLNEIYLGEGAYGVEAAARTYFGKKASAIDLGGDRPAGRPAAVAEQLFADQTAGGGQGPAALRAQPHGRGRHHHRRSGTRRL